jgi:hypothetical protein
MLADGEIGIPALSSSFDALAPMAGVEDVESVRDKVFARGPRWLSFSSVNRRLARTGDRHSWRQVTHSERQCSINYRGLCIQKESKNIHTFGDAPGHCGGREGLI